MKVEVKGTVHKVLNETVGKNNTPKRTVVVNIKSEYNPYLPIDFIGKSLENSNGVKEGDSVTIHTNLGGREWNGRYFPSVSGWKIETHGSQSSSSQPEGNGLPKGTEFSSPPESDEEDDLPF